MTDKGNQVLKCVETVIKKDLNESTASNLEIDCFKMAFVIFSMGHVLAPSTKHDQAIIDYWSAIANTDKIIDFNFCDYVFADLLAACWKVKQDIQNNRPVTHLMGCHLFFQIFYLDNLDLGMLNLPHNTYPRISSFDESRIRKMIIQCTKIGPGPPDFSLGQIRHHSQICYMRSVWDSKTDANTSTSKKPVIPSQKTTVTESPQPFSAGTSSFLTNMPTPSEFTSILKHNYPQLAHSKLGILLNQHNAVIFKACNEMKRSVYEENTRFLHSAVSTLSKSCISCTLRGTTCIAQELQPPETPLLSNLYRHSKQQSKSEGATSAAPKDKHKAATSSHTINDLTPSHKKSRINSYAAAAEVTPKNSKLQAQPEDSKSRGSHMRLPVIALVTGSTIIDQLYGCKLLHHEACCLLFRRFNQIDNQSLFPGSTPKWRRYIEADFSTGVLAGNNVWDMVSAQKQFIPQDISLQMPNTRLDQVQLKGKALQMLSLCEKLLHHLIAPPSYYLPTTAQPVQKLIFLQLHQQASVCFLQLLFHYALRHLQKLE